LIHIVYIVNYKKQIEPKNKDVQRVSYVI